MTKQIELLRQDMVLGITSTTTLSFIAKSPQ